MPAAGIPAGVAFVEVRMDPKDYLGPAMEGASQKAAQSAERNIREGITRGVRSAARGINKAMNFVGAAGGAALAAGIAEGLDIDAARGKLTAQLGLTQKEAQRIGGVAGQVFADAYGESMQDVNDAIKSVVQNMDGMRNASAKSLKDTTERAMTLAQIMDEEVGATTNAVAQMLRTGLAKSAQEAFDVLTRGVQLGANKAQDLLDTFNEYGTQFRKLGLDGKTAMGLITQGLQAGARDADIVADAIKEFSIRAIDGSKTSAAAFQALGLDANAMAAQIGKGGPAAQKAFGIVLDRLRAMHDPVQREAAAVGLFGTQAEDMGKALFALDPTKAAARMGNLAGATDRAGQAMGQTAASQFTAFKRAAQTSIVNVIVAEVIPALKQFSTVLADMGVNGNMIARAAIATVALAAAWKAVAAAIAVATFQVGRFSIVGVFTSGATAVSGFVAGLRNVNLAYAANATFAQRLGSAIAGHIAMLRAQAAAQGVSTARLILYNTWSKIVAVATRIWAAAQWALNAAMLNNPIGYVVIALVALGALFVLLWNRSETFRTIVTAAWNAIRAGALVLWNWIKIAWNGIWSAIQTAWGYIQPVFNVIKNVLYNVLRVYFIILMNEVKIAWIAIQIAIKVAWAIIRPIFNLIKWYIVNVVIAYFKLLWTVAKAVWNGIVAVIRWAWNSIIKPIWNLLKAAITALIITPFRNMLSAARSVWNSLQQTIVGVYNNHIRPAFDRLKQAVGAVKSAFKTAVDGIGKIWHGLINISKTPVNFVIGLYNDGIVNLVNRIASFAGIKTRLDKIPKFAKGGVMPGYAPGRDTLMAAVSPGEAILRPEFTRAVGPQMINAWNGIARRYGPTGIRRWFASGGGKLGGEGLKFSKGGIVPGGFAGNFGLGGIVDGFIKGLKNFTFGNVERVAKSTLDKLLGGNVPGSGLFRDAIAAIPSRLKSMVLQWVKKYIGFGGGKGMRNALNWARAQVGKPYIWGGVGPGGYDCSGFQSAIANVIQGKSPYSRRFTTFSFSGSSAPSGFAYHRLSGYRVGVTNAGVGHMAGTLLGKNVESSGSAGVRVGGGARGYNDGLFPSWYGWKADTGGGLLPGWNPPIYNGTGQIEPILNPRQATLAEKALDLANSGNGGGTIHDNRTYIYPRQANFTVQDLEALEKKRDALARVGRPK